MANIEDHQGIAVLLTDGSGAKQGGTVAPQEYCLNYDFVIAQWINETAKPEDQELFKVTDPITEEEVDVSFGRYADDLARVGIAHDSPQTAGHISQWDQTLDNTLQNIGLGQNHDTKKMPSTLL